MDIVISLEGTSPLLMHNSRMADPDYALNREIKTLTMKRKKTDDDYARVELLEWFGSLYEENGRIIQPTTNLRTCLIETGRISKQGKQVERSVHPGPVSVPVTYDGPQDPKAVYATGNGFVSRLSVRVGRSRVMRVRPQFMPWALEVPATFLEDAGLNFDDLARIVELAGRATGIGDGRTIGYGRFIGKVTTL